MFYDDKTRFCSIYKTRPIICNIEKVYELYFWDKIKKDEYYKLNYEVCKKLKEKNDN